MSDQGERRVVKSGGSTRSKFRARRELEALVAGGWAVVSETEDGWLGFTRTVYVLERSNAGRLRD